MKLAFDQERGFVALVSALIVSAILMVSVLASCAASFYVRMDVLGSEEKVSAASYAKSCIEVALLELATSSDPMHFTAVNQKVVLDEVGVQTCLITSVVHAGSTLTIAAKAAAGDSFSEATATVTLPPNISVVSWSESH